MPKLPSPENALPSIVPPGWWPCFNVTSETIPGFAHVKFCTTRYDPADADQVEIFNANVDQVNYQHSQELFNGQPIIRVRKPTEADDSDTSQVFSWFTWEHPILPHGFGLVTRELLVRALVYASQPLFQVAVGSLLGACEDNRWALKDFNDSQPPGATFVCIMMDATDRRSRRPREENAANKPTVCWVERVGGVV